MTAQLPRFDLGRSLSSAMRALQQVSETRKPALTQQTGAPAASSQVKPEHASGTASSSSKEGLYERELLAILNPALPKSLIVESSRLPLGKPNIRSG